MITTYETRQLSFEDIKDKRQRRYNQILDRLDKPKTAKEIAVELFDLGLIPSTERNYTSPRLTELEKMGIVKAIIGYNDDFDVWEGFQNNDIKSIATKEQYESIKYEVN